MVYATTVNSGEVGHVEVSSYGHPVIRNDVLSTTCEPVFSHPVCTNKVLVGRLPGNEEDMFCGMGKAHQAKGAGRFGYSRNSDLQRGFACETGMANY